MVNKYYWRWQVGWEIQQTITSDNSGDVSYGPQQSA